MRDGIETAKRGLPTVALVTEEFWAQGDFVAQAAGMPTLPRHRLPHPVAGTGEEAMAKLANEIADRLIDRLRDGSEPSTPASTARPDRNTVTRNTVTRNTVARNTVLETGSEAEAQDWLHDNRCTDGLPVVVPTPDRVDRMVLATGLDGDLQLGVMAPGGGAATVEKIAASTIMAGCAPDHMPVVLAAVRAVLQPEFDLGEMQGTTHCTAPLIVVNGPARIWARVASGFGALGPGHRANASIGRALRLCMINIGMAWPGESDMALLGHPGKFTFCLAEAEELSPWEPMHTELGYNADQSAVTVIGAEPPHSVLFSNDADDPTSPDRLLASLGAVLANLGSNNVHFGGGRQVVILNPEHAQVLAEAGLDRAQVKARLTELAVQPLSEVARLNPAFTRPARPGEGADSESMRSALRSPADLMLLVAGGPGLYSVVMPSWAAGAHMNTSVHAEIITDQSCVIPAPA